MQCLHLQHKGANKDTDSHLSGSQIKAWSIQENIYFYQSFQRHSTGQIWYQLFYNMTMKGFRQSVNCQSRWLHCRKETVWMSRKESSRLCRWWHGKTLHTDTFLAFLYNSKNCSLSWTALCVSFPLCLKLQRLKVESFLCESSSHIDYQYYPHQSLSRSLEVKVIHSI